MSMTEPTAGPEYARRMIERTAVTWKELLDVQAPYRLHIRTVCRGRVLDVGCGIGRNLAHLVPRAVGVDHNPHAVEFARTRGFTAYRSIEFPDSGDAHVGGYASLLFAHVLEHMTRERAQELLRAYLPYLRPGGRVVLICPQERGFASDPTHVEFLGFADLAEVCRRAGLLVRRRYSFPLPRPAGRLFTHNEFVVLADKPRAVLA